MFPGRIEQTRSYFNGDALPCALALGGTGLPYGGTLSCALALGGMRLVEMKEVKEEPHKHFLPASWLPGDSICALPCPSHQVD